MSCFGRNRLELSCPAARTETAYIEVGSPWQNPFFEGFNGKT
jgi:hypothetical protein